jgi:hypothetical protein
MGSRSQHKQHAEPGLLVDFSDTNSTPSVDNEYLYLRRDDNYSGPSDWLSDTGMLLGEQQNPYFIVWMKQATFVPFRKLYAVSKTG